MLTNKRLYDVLTRHQIYVEGVKNQFSLEFNSVVKQLEKEITNLLLGLRIKTMDELTKAKLRSFLVQLNKSQSVIYSSYTASLIAKLQEFAKADTKVSKVIYATVKKDEEKPISEEEEADSLMLEQDEENTIYPPIWFSKYQDGAKVWSAITSSPIPANGILPLKFISLFTASAMLQIQNAVSKGYANRSTIEEVLTEIIGTESLKNKDGLLRKISAQFDAVTSTAIQHVSSVIQAGVASIFFGKYRWVSVLDYVTTEICRFRNNKVYVYGKGPLPPAHIRCRSKTIPAISGDEYSPASYFDWIAAQSKSVQSDILGKNKANDLQSGKLKAKDLQKFDDATPISISGFVDKLDQILTR